MAEMAERAQLISQEAGTKIAAAMKEVIGAAAGIAGFAVESARDLVQYMVRRGQMTQDEADKLIREAEDAHTRKSGRVKAETTAEVVRRDPAKQTAHAGKKSAPSAAAAKAEKKPAAKRAATPKKTNAKHATSKKRR
jgi:polyhydroxyalkanoate synthesis regulator phasin